MKIFVFVAISDSSPSFGSGTTTILLLLLSKSPSSSLRWSKDDDEVSPLHETAAELAHAKVTWVIVPSRSQFFSRLNVESALFAIIYQADSPLVPSATSSFVCLSSSSAKHHHHSLFPQYIYITNILFYYYEQPTLIFGVRVRTPTHPTRMCIHDRDSQSSARRRDAIACYE